MSAWIIAAIGWGQLVMVDLGYYEPKSWWVWADGLITAICVLGAARYWKDRP
jgi:hypothetical protein